MLDAFSLPAPPIASAPYASWRASPEAMEGEALQARGALPLNLPVQVPLEIRGFTLLAYRLPEARLRAHVPEALPLYVFEEDGQRWAWLTIFLGEVGPRGLTQFPALPVSFYQVNYRAHMRVDGVETIFIFRSAIGQPLAAAGSRAMLNFPASWRSATVAGFGQPDQRIRIGDEGEELQLETAAAGPLPAVSPFETPEAAKAFFTDVPLALFAADGLHLRKMVSPHPPLAPVACRLKGISMPWAQGAGLLTEAEAREPVAIYWQRCAPFPVRI